MASPDVSALSTSFIEGASVFGKAVLDWDIKNLGIQVRTNVKAPQALTKLSMTGAPQPYRKQDDFYTATFSDRTLTVYQSKYDFDYDAENERNTYLATLPEAPFGQWALQQASKKYLDALMTSTLWLGVRNGSGTAAADICNGWGKIIADEITATTLTPVATGAVTSSNAVTAVKSVIAAAPIWMRQKGGIVMVSYDVFDYYATHYASLYGFQFNPSATGEYRINNTNFVLRPAAFMGTSNRIVATAENNLVFGTDLDAIQVYSTPHFNILQNRLMKPAGCQIQDLSAIVVNNQA